MTRFQELGICAVPTLYRGPYKDDLFEGIARSLDMTKREGYVVRTAGAFAETAMPECVGKYVRAGHVQADIHWMKAGIVPNKLAE